MLQQSSVDCFDFFIDICSNYAIVFILLLLYCNCSGIDIWKGLVWSPRYLCIFFFLLFSIIHFYKQNWKKKFKMFNTIAVIYCGSAHEYLLFDFHEPLCSFVFSIQLCYVYLCCLYTYNHACLAKVFDYCQCVLKC